MVSFARQHKIFDRSGLLFT
uniref:Uncharacterized protein n=1 Tax=Anguilla anguilla TaxID=7936 RepID=A0A0E9SSW1_ANGAN